MSNPSARKRVVIVGGQFAGREAATYLSKKDFETVVVDDKEYFEFTPNALRNIVEPSNADKSIAPHKPAAVVGRASRVQVDKGSQVGIVHLQDGKELEFDYLVVATGSSYVNPVKPTLPTQGTIEARKAAYQAAYKRVSEATSILVVGGGTVGVELAAEVTGQFGKTKSVTLVASTSRLLDRLPAKAGAIAIKWLTSRGVAVVLDDRVVDLQQAVEATQAGQTVTVATQGGRSIQADLVFSCVGQRANSSVLDSLLQGAAVEGWQSGSPVPVHSTLQVKGLPPFIFAAGDCTDTPEEKTAYIAGLAGAVAAKNVERLSKGQELLTFPKAAVGSDTVPVVAIVSLHKGVAIFVMKSFVFSGCLPALMKKLIVKKYI